MARTPTVYGIPATLENAGRIAKRYYSLKTDEQFLVSRHATDYRWMGSDIGEIFDVMWQCEFDRRFLLRPLVAKPNTQDGTTLVRAI